jgi:hypothetical protein
MGLLPLDAGIKVQFLTTEPPSFFDQPVIHEAAIPF